MLSAKFAMFFHSQLFSRFFWFESNVINILTFFALQFHIRFSFSCHICCLIFYIGAVCADFISAFSSLEPERRIGLLTSFLPRKRSATELLRLSEIYLLNLTEIRLFGNIWALYCKYLSKVLGLMKAYFILKMQICFQSSFNPIHWIRQKLEERKNKCLQ